MNSRVHLNNRQPLWPVVLCLLIIGSAYSLDVDMRAAVEADWRRQEARLERSLESPAALNAVYARARLLLADLESLADHAERQGRLDLLGARVAQARRLKRSDREALYLELRCRCFHLYAMDSDGGNLRQLTGGPDDDFDPCPLPDGGIAFMSTRRGGFTCCNNPWEPLPAHSRLDALSRQYGP